MLVLGIEFESNQMNYVLVDGDANAHTIVQRNRLVLGDTRSREALVAFQVAVQTLYNAARPELIAIKSKPESGQLRAGAAALKMEGIALANAPCEVTFISGAKINRCDSENDVIHKYQLAAYKAAVVAFG